MMPSLRGLLLEEARGNGRAEALWLWESWSAGNGFAGNGVRRRMGKPLLNYLFLH